MTECDTLLNDPLATEWKDSGGRSPSRDKSRCCALGQGSATTEEEIWGHASQLTSPRNWSPSVVAVTDTETHIKYSEEDSRNFF